MLIWLIRGSLVFISTIWAVIGFLFWIPFLTRMIAVFVFAVLSSVTHASSTINAEKGLKVAISFYMDGFSLIWGVLDIDKTENQSYVSPKGKDLYYNFLETFFFWIVLLLLYGFIPIPSLDGIENFIDTTGPIITKITTMIVGFIVVFLIAILIIKLLYLSILSERKRHKANVIDKVPSESN